MKLNAAELRTLEERRATGEMHEVKRRPLYFILENIYDTYNVGGIFRLADALAVSKIYLCGEMETPPNHKIKKASIGTYKIVPWVYKKTAEEAIENLRLDVRDEKLDADVRSEKEFKYPTSIIQLHTSYLPLRIIAVEQDKRSIPYTKANYSLPLALVLGNESYGVTKETLDLVDQIVEIPMFGINKSLNVIVSAAIVSYYAIRTV